MAIEDEHADVLQNIEFAIASVHRSEPRLLDFDVIEALDALVRGYGLDEQGQSWPIIRLSDRAGLVVEACRRVCEWRLGRASMPSSAGHGVGPAPIPVSTIVACLKRLRKSVRLWNKRNGRQGYLEFVEPFLP